MSEERVNNITAGEDKETAPAAKPEKKKKKKKKALKVLCIIAIVIVVIAALTAALNAVSVASNRNFIKSIPAVEYENQLVPELDKDGFYSFTKDEPLKVMQLTDVHIGGGILSIKKDNLALNAVSAMIRAEKPDLVVVTGDVAYPVPFQSGTFNNKSGAVTFAQLMEKLGVYWTLAFGNHDTELYSFYTREQICDIYTGGSYPHCLLQAGPEDVDGTGNYVVNVRNSAGKITQSLFMLDSHSYVDNDYFGVMWKYDTIHENQVKWYENTLRALAAENGGTMPKSMVFFHIPIEEYKTAYEEYKANGHSDTADVHLYYGKAGEKGELVYVSNYNYGMFEKAKELGSTQAMFCGHDHLNTFSLDYKGIRLSYSNSVDYLAYVGIMKYGVQRGCTIIEINPDGTYDCHPENYYQDKYVPVNAKETVTMEDMHPAGEE